MEVKNYFSHFLLSLSFPDFGKNIFTKNVQLEIDRERERHSVWERVRERDDLKRPLFFASPAYVSFQSRWSFWLGLCLALEHTQKHTHTQTHTNTHTHTFLPACSLVFLSFGNVKVTNCFHFYFTNSLDKKF